MRARHGSAPRSPPRRCSPWAPAPPRGGAATPSCTPRARTSSQPIRSRRCTRSHVRSSATRSSSRWRASTAPSSRSRTSPGAGSGASTDGPSPFVSFEVCAGTTARRRPPRTSSSPSTRRATPRPATPVPRTWTASTRCAPSATRPWSCTFAGRPPVFPRCWRNCRSHRRTCWHRPREGTSDARRSTSRPLATVRSGSCAGNRGVAGSSSASMIFRSCLAGGPASSGW